MKIHHLLLMLFLLALTGCQSIDINEQNFLRNRSDTILYNMIIKDNVTIAELAATTRYQSQKIQDSLHKLQQEGAVISNGIGEQVRWQLSPQQRQKDRSYIAKISQFSINELDKQLTTHKVSEHFFAKTGIYGLSVLADDPQVSIVFFGGNDFRINPDVLEALEQLVDEHTNLFLMDYPGVGNSQGEVSVKSMRQDGVDFAKFVQRHTATQNTPIVYYGFSLGGFVASYVATAVEPDGLILEATADTVDNWIKYNIPWYGRSLVEVNVSPELAQLNNAQLLAKTDMPLLILASKQDEVTSVAMAQTLYASAQHNTIVQLEIVEGAPHGEIGQVANYQTLLHNFVQQLVKKPLKLEALDH